MNEFRELLKQFWIVREENPALYNSIRRAIPSFQKLVQEQLSWHIISNEKLIKLEKLPANANPTMGIEEFTEQQDYCVLCALLIFLDDRYEGERFLLSELTPILLSLLSPELPSWNWELFSARKSLVRVLRYCETIGLLRAKDGNSGSYEDNAKNEVLYENTGLSRWYAVNFGYDISSCESAADFENEGFDERNADRGALRVRRVHRQLALSPGMHWEEADDAAYAYIKNQRAFIQRNLEALIGGQLEVYKNGAYFVLSDDDTFALYHPGHLQLSDIALLICLKLRTEVLEWRAIRMQNDFVEIPLSIFSRLLGECKKQYSHYWGKTIRECSIEKLTELVLDYMESWMLLIRNAETVLILPSAAIATGVYTVE